MKRSNKARKSSAKEMTADDILKKLNSVKWFLSFEIIPGVISPGLYPFNAGEYADRLGIPKRLDGMRALDIGTWDGPMAFELEKRGADVVASDIQYPDKTGFNIAKELKKSRMEYVQGSVYDLRKLLKGKFDIVTYLGVYYHLKYPLLGFESISQVMKMNGMLYFSGECFISYAETLTGQSAGDVAKIAGSDVPIALSYPGIYKQAGNWVIPNVACIRSWLTAAGFEYKNHALLHDPAAKPHPVQRVSCTARKISDVSAVEHPLVGIDFWKKDSE
jgi:tRNA (mo5U34)-methyltransferase